MAKSKGLGMATKTKPKSAKSSPRKSNLPRAGSEERFQAEQDLRTMRSAGEISSDKNRMSQVRKLAAHESQSLNQIANKK